jgi:hypothetical protein
MRGSTGLKTCLYFEISLSSLLCPPATVSTRGRGDGMKANACYGDARKWSKNVALSFDPITLEYRNGRKIIHLIVQHSSITGAMMLWWTSENIWREKWRWTAMGHGGLSLFLQHNVRRQGSSRSAANRGCELLVREKRESLSRDSRDTSGLCRPLTSDSRQGRRARKGERAHDVRMERVSRTHSGLRTLCFVVCIMDILEGELDYHCASSFELFVLSVSSS